MANALGRKPPKDFEHVSLYPLSALPVAEQPTKVPVVIGINWYTAFDKPEKIGHRYWVGKDGNLGSIRGGHCVCIPSQHTLDLFSWWDFYNQGNEGACVGFGSSRMMSLLNRNRYYARWLWDQAKIIDDWPDTNPGDDEGTSVHAALDVLRNTGHVRWAAKYEGDTVEQRDARQAAQIDGIAANRWATTIDEMLQVLDSPLYSQLEAFPIFNSWGRDYPHKTWIPFPVMERLISEDGEVGLVTDR